MAQNKINLWDDGGELLEPTIHRRSISPNPRTAEIELMEIIADIEGIAEEELPILWRDADHMISNLFESPPGQHAQMELTFTYAGYRISISQSGDVTLAERSWF